MKDWARASTSSPLRICARAPVEVRLIFGIPVDEITHADDKFGPEQIQAVDGVGKNPAPSAPRAIGDNGKLEVSGVRVEVQVGPGRDRSRCLDAGSETDVVLVS
ncbi:uncharacterized protein METZ01_LOCUS251376 [marine metagenome]|uniref:Uncharacterized protein n=1 Tax=marine metagenome TaxID=408172 RepID=A0A382IGY7_9ZZZZ